jgi:quercetin dioxygenase-like cupin family protein
MKRRDVVAQPGQIITNPVTGEEITFLKTTRETGGEHLIFECRATPGGAVLPAHIHTNQEEHFTVLAGRLGVLCGDETYTVHPGQSITLPAGIKHQWWTLGEEVLFRVQVTPARNLERVLEAVCGLAHAGKLNGKAMPSNPFLLAELGLLSQNYLPGIPIWLQKIGLTMGGMVSHMLSYDLEFESHIQATRDAALVSVPLVEEGVA